MIKLIQKATASSKDGAVGLIKGIIACAFQNMAFMLPTGLLYYLVKDLLGGDMGGKTVFYTVGCVICFALILITTWFQYNNTFFTTYEESGKRRLSLAERLRKLPLSFFGKKDLADLTSTIMADCEVLEKDCSHYIPALFGSVISTIVIALGLFAFDKAMALAALWVIPVSVLIIVLSYKVQDRAQQRNMSVKMACADGIQEYIETLRDLKANNAESSYLKGLRSKIRSVEKGAFKTEITTAVFVTSAGMVLKFGIATVALVGVSRLVTGKIDVLTLFMFLLVASRLYDPMQAALQNLAAVIAMRTNVARMNEILDHEIQQGGDTLTNKGCDITFDHVGFAYKSGETVLSDVSFTAKQGEVTALVGPSGGGKTTVSRLAVRFWDNQKGKITVGGMDISKIDPEKLMTLYSIVFQDVTLFNNTIMENIRYGRLDATDEEVIAAAKAAHAHHFIQTLPGGYDMELNEDASNVSQGQKQLLTIARAILADNPILILDEATSSVDTRTEIRIQKALDNLMRGRTSFVIAHRLSTIKNADMILVMKDGDIIEQGTHDELLAKNGFYAELYNSQFEE